METIKIDKTNFFCIPISNKAYMITPKFFKMQNKIYFFLNKVNHFKKILLYHLEVFILNRLFFNRL